MKRLSELPQRLFAVAQTSFPFVLGDVYGPYVRYTDAYKAQKRLNGAQGGDGWHIIEADLTWREM